MTAIAAQRASVYPRALIALHWATALIIVAVAALMELREIFPKGSDPREAMKALHFMLGLTVLGLVAVRIWVRFGAAVPQISPSPPAWQTGLGHLAHAALYALMISLPILGWLTLSAGGKSIPFFGLSLPALVAENKDMATWYKEIHQLLGDALYIVVGIHAAAALFHHYAVKDNTLTRMLPAK